MMKGAEKRDEDGKSEWMDELMDGWMAQSVLRIFGGASRG